ncbi:MAG: hypothetical protein FWC47_14495 [Oscillospiraceae bacterium]|nr:hypothetical protein [Oscillospiraceae bacterium]
MIIPQGKTCTRILRSSTTTLVELSDGNVWGCGYGDTGGLGYRSSESTTVGSTYDPYFLTNMVTLEQVKLDGTLKTLTPYNVAYRTTPDIYRTLPGTMSYSEKRFFLAAFLKL